MPLSREQAEAAAEALMKDAQRTLDARASRRPARAGPGQRWWTVAGNVAGFGVGGFVGALALDSFMMPAVVGMLLGGMTGSFIDRGWTRTSMVFAAVACLAVAVSVVRA